MDRRVSTVVNLMKERMSDDITVREMARVVSIGPSRLRSIFKQELGTSPKQYLRTLRMHRAKELLETTFLSVKEVAAQSGASSVGHFARRFEAAFGETPAHDRAKSQRTPELSTTPVAGSRNGR